MHDSLLWALARLGLEVTDVRSEEDYATAAASRPVDAWDYVFFDQWTLWEPSAMGPPGPLPRFPGLRVKPGPGGPGSHAAEWRRLRRRLFVLSFFGVVGEAHPIRQAGVLARHVLTPYPSNAENTFLGIRIPPSDGEGGEGGGRGGGEAAETGRAGQAYGVVWGKEVRYYRGKEDLLRAILALNVTLVSTLRWLSAARGVGRPLERFDGLIATT